MKTFLLLIAASVLLICCHTNEVNVPSETATSSAPVTSSLKLSEQQINKILDTVQRTSLLKAAAKIIDSASMGKRGVSFMADSVAFHNDEVYIAAGDNRPERFETFLNLYVNINNYNIRVFDVIHNDTVDIAEYERRQNKNR